MQECPRIEVAGSESPGRSAGEQSTARRQVPVREIFRQGEEETIRPHRLGGAGAELAVVVRQREIRHVQGRTASVTAEEAGVPVSRHLDRDAMSGDRRHAKNATAARATPIWAANAATRVGRSRAARRRWKAASWPGVRTRAVRSGASPRAKPNARPTKHPEAIDGERRHAASIA